MGSNAGRVESIVADRENIRFIGTLHQGVRAESLKFWLYELNPYDTVSGEAHSLTGGEEQIGEMYGDGRFIVTIPRYQGYRDRIYSKYVVGIKGAACTAVMPLDGVCYVTGFDGISKYDYPYPTANTKKGLQVKMIDDAINLGIGHAALNLNLPTIALPKEDKDTIPYTTDGETFYFNEAYLRQFDKRIKALSDAGVVVTLILLNSPSWDGINIHNSMRRVLLHPDYNPEGYISAFNVVDMEGWKYYKAFVEFVADRYTRPDRKYGRACGFIIGNEIDSQWVWCNGGEKRVDEYVNEYAIALRTAFYAARKKYSQARVYVSLDHFWASAFQDNPMRCYPGRKVLDELKELVLKEGNFDWSIAYHPYPDNIFRANFWDDDSACFSFDTPKITFKNIEILPRYLSQDSFRYKGRIRHIILSEQGFHSDENEESEKLQAAAFCLAYRKIERIPEIEAFILHAHVDNRDEFGLNLGLWRRDKNSDIPNAPESPKPIYWVFKGIDGPNKEEVSKFAKEIVGDKNWI